MMYQILFIITFKRIFEAIESCSDHGDGWLWADESLWYSSLSTHGLLPILWAAITLSTSSWVVFTDLIDLKICCDSI